jgi:hypothetical protein
MADVRGPYQSLTAVRTPSIDVIEAGESTPAVFYCTFTCQDFTHNDYDFRLYTDIIYDPSLSNRHFGREFIFLEMENLHKEDHFSIATTAISSCNNRTNKSTYEIQINLSIDQETPTLIPKCAVRNRHTNNLCFGSDTFVIIPKANPVPTATTPLTSSRIFNETQSCTSYISAFGSGFGVVGVLLAIETAILISLLVCCFVKKSKNKINPQGSSDEVENISGANRSNRVANLSLMTTYNQPQLMMMAENDSAMGTVSTISDSVGDVNIM